MTELRSRDAYVFRLYNDGPQGLATAKYLTTMANNYWKTIAKKVIYIPRTMPKSVRIFSLFLVNDARLRKNFKNSCFVFHRGFQTLENNKSTRPTASCFHQFPRVWKPRWNTRTRFWNITSRTAQSTVWHPRVVHGAMHSGKEWRSAVWLNAMHSGKKCWIQEFVLPSIGESLLTSLFTFLLNSIRLT